MNKGSKILLALVLCCGIVACSQEEEAKPEAGSPEPGAIEQLTNQTAKQAEQKIRSPIDKARATQGQGDERLEGIDDAVKKQQQ